QVREWSEQGEELSVAVNLSARSFLDAQLAVEIPRLLERTGVDARLLELEITESMLMLDPARAKATLERLSAIGLPLSVDAFGSGPNGLAAAIVLAQAGRDVTVLEAEDSVGGGCRSAELTLPGYVHDICSTVHVLAAASPFLRTLPLPKLAHPDVPLAHPLDDGTAVLAARSIAETAAGLGPDERAY